MDIARTFFDENPHALRRTLLVRFGSHSRLAWTELLSFIR